jgi:CubicO group peptidase (beta-lactamase class C family)
MLDRTDDPQTIGLSLEGMEGVYRILEESVDKGKLMGAAIQVSRNGVALGPRSVGWRMLDPGGPPVEPDTIFLVASVTKPMTVAAAMVLVERGKLCLDDRVCDFIPEFAQRGKEGVRVRHLMTHTSGLVDMLPDNLILRSTKAPLKTFVQRICEEGLLFPPGTHISYQSMGLAILGEIMERIEGIPLPEVMRKELFQPLGLSDISLGVQDTLIERVSAVNVAGSKHAFESPNFNEWNLNSAYWRSFAAPWGGMFATVGNLTVLCQMFLGHGRIGDVRVLSPATAKAMTSDQTSLMPGIPERVKLSDRWGLGWRIVSPNSTSWFGDLVSNRTYGHIGSTGTMVWMDPEYGLACVLFTNDPTGADILRPKITNAVMGALVQ